jgi:hypothetical protein
MKQTTPWALTVLALCLLGSSCMNEKPMPPVLTESQVLELAEREFRNTGRKVADYRITVQQPTNDHDWIVRFDLDVPYIPPGGTHWVRVEQQTGRATFMPGE